MYGPWNPGIRSRVPKELQHLATIFRPENAFNDVAVVRELQGLTGFSSSELVAFRPQRLALHELLIRVTADFAVPDGSRIGDLGINFREIASRLFERHLAPIFDKPIVRWLTRQPASLYGLGIPPAQYQALASDSAPSTSSESSSAAMARSAASRNGAAILPWCT